MPYKAQDYAPSNSIITFPQLTATGRTDHIELLSHDGLMYWSSALFVATIAGMTTSVDIILEGSLDGINWFYLSNDDDAINYTADGTYALRWEGTGEINFIRFYFETETGGTAATIDVVAKIFGPKGANRP